MLLCCLFWIATTGLTGFINPSQGKIKFKILERKIYKGEKAICTRQWFFLFSLAFAFICSLFLCFENRSSYFKKRHDNKRAHKNLSLRWLLIPHSFHCVCIRRTPLIFGLSTSLMAKSLATTIATYSEFNVKCMASNPCHQPEENKREKVTARKETANLVETDIARRTLGSFLWIVTHI